MDLEVLSYLVRNMKESSVKLELAVAKNKIEEAAKIKKIILKLSERFSEELDGNRQFKK